MTFTIPDEVHSVQGPVHSDLAEPKSRDFEALAQRDTGVVSGCGVTEQGTPDMTLAVASGVVRIAGVNHAVTGGNVTITANASGQPRYDAVVVNTSGTKSVIAGTPAAETTLDDPVIDFTVFAWLAKVYVAAGATAISATEMVSKAIPQNPNGNHVELHAAAHATGGADAVTPAGIGASATAHTHTHAATTGQGTDDHHAKAHTNADHPAAGTPSTQAFGDAAAPGSSTSDAKSDHKHGMPATPAPGNLTGDVTSTGLATTIANDAVTYAKAQNVSATARALGRKTAGAGDIEELSASDIWTILGSPGLSNPMVYGGFQAMNVDVRTASSGTILVSGTQNIVKIAIPRSITVSTISISLIALGVTLTAGQNLLGIYDSTGALLAWGSGTAGAVDNATDWAAGNQTWHHTAITKDGAGGTIASVALTGGLNAWCWVSILSVGTTPINPLRVSNPHSGTLNGLLTAAAANNATVGTSKTALMTSFTPSNNSLTNTCYVVALS